ncbi:MAG: sigma-70 family RNA polymerase sigma factor [Thermomicrobiales bacterium]|nr:sigma-70 family RNA polymerase sigma factor [Thermomicrobiales bacterium]
MPLSLRAISELDDAGLLAAAKEDRALFAHLYDRYVHQVYRYCDRRLCEREAAEDATSQTFEKAFAGLARCPEEALRAWLFTIAHNVVVDVQRKQRPQQPLEDATSVADDEPNPEDVLLAGEVIKSVRDLLPQLSPDQRAVIELRLAGLNGTETMEVLGISRDVLGSRTYRALARMRTLLIASETTNLEVPQ